MKDSSKGRLQEQNDALKVELAQVQQDNLNKDLELTLKEAELQDAKNALARLPELLESSTTLAKLVKNQNESVKQIREDMEKGTATITHLTALVENLKSIAQAQRRILEKHETCDVRGILVKEGAEVTCETCETTWVMKDVNVNFPDWDGDILDGPEPQVMLHWEIKIDEDEQEWETG
jgi:DNA repair exonuclease SbcCD ATPase subunit